MGITTLTADSQVAGPWEVLAGQSLELGIKITATMTTTIQRFHNAAGWIAVEAGYTSSVSKTVDSPGKYQVIASGTSGGNAIVHDALI